MYEQMKNQTNWDDAREATRPTNSTLARQKTSLWKCIPFWISASQSNNTNPPNI